MTVRAWIEAERWPFHGTGAAAPYFGESIRSFWIGGDAGLLRLFDLGDPTPLFDLRIRAAHRGRGLGTSTVRWLTGQVFADKERIGGCTTADNAAMIRTFEKCGWTKEAHYRRAWRSAEGLLDAVGYGILRTEYRP